ncbi:uncharacterized protein [Equus caballus]|uniref:uncharacterized protein n=1 Tax=Equus caballus TaxID=9796 RepID=UPI0038B25E6D
MQALTLILRHCGSFKEASGKAGIQVTQRTKLAPFVAPQTAFDDESARTGRPQHPQGCWARQDCTAHLLMATCLRASRNLAPRSGAFRAGGKGGGAAARASGRGAQPSALPGSAANVTVRAGSRRLPGHALRRRRSREHQEWCALTSLGNPSSGPPSPAGRLPRREARGRNAAGEAGSPLPRPAHAGRPGAAPCRPSAALAARRLPALHAHAPEHSGTCVLQGDQAGEVTKMRLGRLLAETCADPYNTRGQLSPYREMSRAVILIPLQQMPLHPNTSGLVINSAAGHPGKRFTFYHHFLLQTLVSVFPQLLTGMNGELKLTCCSLY